MYGLACGHAYGSPPFPHCPLAGADAPFDLLQPLIAGSNYPVPPAKTLLVLPAVGFWFDCVDAYGPGVLPPPHCKMSSDNRISYHTALALLAATKANKSLIGSDATLDAQSATMFFNWHLPSAVALPTAVPVQQVWIDTAETIGAKVAWGRKQGLRGCVTTRLLAWLVATSLSP